MVSGSSETKDEGKGNYVQVRGWLGVCLSISRRCKAILRSSSWKTWTVQLGSGTVQDEDHKIQPISPEQEAWQDIYVSRVWILLVQGPQRYHPGTAPDGPDKTENSPSTHESMAKGIQASAEEAILQDPEKQAGRPLQLLLCTRKFPFSVVVLLRSNQLCKEVVEPQEPTEKLYLGKVQASAWVHGDTKTETYGKETPTSGCVGISWRGNEYNRGTGCGKTARPGLCGGCQGTGIPITTNQHWNQIFNITLDVNNGMR